jgi:glycogen debranching enzyme
LIYLNIDLKAPEMFDKTHIWLALKQVETILLGKYGIKTLDPR